jgi:lipoyl-dependent peroxiredoxin
MTKLEKTLYTARVRTTGGREGQSRSDDGKLEVTLARPGSNAPGTNPEQMFAAGYSACFIGAMKSVAAKMNVKLPDDLAVDAEVDLGPIREGAAFGIAARLNVSLPGLDRAQAQQVLDAAHQVCPYSNATRGNVDVQISLA